MKPLGNGILAYLGFPVTINYIPPGCQVLRVLLPRAGLLLSVWQLVTSGQCGRGLPPIFASEFSLIGLGVFETLLR